MASPDVDPYLAPIVSQSHSMVSSRHEQIRRDKERLQDAIVELEHLKVVENKRMQDRVHALNATFRDQLGRLQERFIQEAFELSDQFKTNVQECKRQMEKRLEQRAGALAEDIGADGSNGSLQLERLIAERNAMLMQDAAPSPQTPLPVRHRPWRRTVQPPDDAAAFESTPLTHGPPSLDTDGSLHIEHLDVTHSPAGDDDVPPAVIDINATAFVPRTPLRPVRAASPTNDAKNDSHSGNPYGAILDWFSTRSTPSAQREPPNHPAESQSRPGMRLSGALQRRQPRRSIPASVSPIRQREADRASARERARKSKFSRQLLRVRSSSSSSMSDDEKTDRQDRNNGIRRHRIPRVSSDEDVERKSDGGRRRRRRPPVTEPTARVHSGLTQRLRMMTSHMFSSSDDEREGRNEPRGATLHAPTPGVELPPRMRAPMTRAFNVPSNVASSFRARALKQSRRRSQ